MGAMTAHQQHQLQSDTSHGLAAHEQDQPGNPDHWHLGHHSPSATWQWEWLGCGGVCKQFGIHEIWPT